MTPTTRISQIIHQLSRPMLPLATEEPLQLSFINDIRAVVFDVYGTMLCSDAGDIALKGGNNRDAALHDTLKVFEISFELEQECNLGSRFQHTLRAHQNRRRNEGIAFPEVDIRAVWVDFLEDLQHRTVIPKGNYSDFIDPLAVSYECSINSSWPMPGLLATLRALREQGIPLAIVSNAQFFTPLLFEELIQTSLEEVGFDRRASVWSYQLLEAKPSPALYERCANGLRTLHSIVPEQVLYIGNDRRKDIWPAQQVGFRTALFAGDARSLRWHREDPELTGVTPDLVIHTLDQILPCILVNNFTLLTRMV